MSKKSKSDDRPFVRQAARIHGPNDPADVLYKEGPPPEPKKRTRLEIQEANFNNTLRYDRIKGKK